MADKHPYANSPGGLLKAINQLRKSFPASVDAKTLKKLGIAPNNESYVLRVIRFLGVIDDKGKKVDGRAKVFLQNDQQFPKEFAKIVASSYHDLFDLFKEDAWKKSKDDLIQFFRTSDHSTELVGKLQAQTFLVLASLAGHGEPPTTRKKGAATAVKKPKKPAGATKSSEPKQVQSTAPPQTAPAASDVGLTVRIEVNLPANGDQETYDAIFQSIRKNLIDRD
tara:strand:+ start:626 stop:1294 length:669 start_codon:yes stop_codon:yes gene_type:complete